MTLYQFNSLPEREQEIAMKEAVLLADREAGEYTIYLFQLNNFYVEVYCHLYDLNLSYYRSFNSVEQLEPYLENIPLGF